jgi:uncharacterized protein involved in response to NO
MFPLGAAFAILGASVWVLRLWFGMPYPGPLHASLMIEGFELSFVSGFLLTVAPRMTRTDPVRGEVPWVALGIILFGAAAWLGFAAAAHACALLTLTLVAVTTLRRFAQRANDPPEEAVFAAVGLALGLAGAAMQFAAAVGPWIEPAPRFGLRLMSLGMVLSPVLGFGALLVPVFLEIKDPLLIPKIARPHERPARRALYAALAILLALTFVADALGARAVGPFGRAGIATIMLVWVWKLWRLPGRRTVPAFVMWSAGWCIGLGLWAAALFPEHEIGALHVTLLGGYGALTMGIASRVVVTHGGHGPDAEGKVLTPMRAALLAVALLARLVAEVAGAAQPMWLAVSALAWIVAWGGWLLAARSSLVRAAAKP